MPNLICRGVSFAYDGAEYPVFDRLDLIIDTGWRTALVGANGRGKTTLLKLLAGVLNPYAGEIERPLSCALFTENAADHPGTAWEAAKDMAGPFRAWEADIERLLAAGDEASLARYGELEPVFRARGGYEIDARLEQELEALDVAPTLWRRAVGTLSGGEQTRCRLAGLFAADGFPLIDEPTNHLDLAGRRLLADYLATKPGFLIVSHDRAFLDEAAGHIIALNRDTVEHHRLRFSEWRGALADRIARQAHKNTELRKEIRKLESAAAARRRGAAAREADKTLGGRKPLPSEHVFDKGAIGSQAAKQMKRALAAERRAERAADERRQSLVDVEKAYPLKLKVAGESVPVRAPLVRATDLAVVRDVPLFEPVRFEVRAGERLAVLGPNGCGKTSLLSVLTGALIDYQGSLQIPNTAIVSRACQQPRWTTGHLKPLLADEGLDEGQFRQIMAALGVRGAVLDQRLDQLSQGQLKKVELARSLATPAHLLLWDEPLNYVDVDTRERIEAAMLESAVAVIFVEHDARFVERITTTSLTLVPVDERARI